MSTSHTRSIALSFIPLLVIGLVFGIYLSASIGSGTRSTTTSVDYSGFITSAQTTNSTLGLELSLSVNSAIIQRGHTIDIQGTVSNTLSKENTLEASANWAAPSLTERACNNFILMDGLAIYKGYYGTNNVSEASPIPFWPILYCPIQAVSSNNTASFLGDLINVTSYTFLPGNQSGYFTGYYYPYNSTCNQPGNCSQYYLKATFGPEPYLGSFGYNVTANYRSTSLSIGYSLNSSQPGVYTIAAGDEWSQEVLLHFAVVP